MTNNVYKPAEAPEAERAKADKKAMASCFSRCGWGVLVLIATTSVISIALSVVMIVLELLSSAEILNVSIMPLYEKYLLYINEALIAIAVGLGALVLIKMPKQAPEKQEISIKSFLVMVCICCTIASVGSFIGTMWESFWSLPFGGVGEDELTAILTGMDPLQMFICTGLLAPIIEEFFFRKLLIDRMYKYGETITIFVTALLFGLFHQNFGQFFYTFGVGLVLGYLYCRTGSYLHVTALHMVFNCLLGVIPTLVSLEILPLAEATENMAFDDLSALLAILGEYATPLIIFAVYMMIRSVLELLGLIFAIVKFKKLSLKKREPALSTADQLYAAFANPGMITACAVLCVMLMTSLIPI